jgi:hypothetical protein
MKVADDCLIYGHIFQIVLQSTVFLTHLSIFHPTLFPEKRETTTFLKNVLVLEA